ncbi:MAG: response regulator [Candidatus Dormibacteria bacterium]
MSDEQRKRILVVDDDPRLLHVVSVYLGGIENYDVVTASSGEEALEVLAGTTPDLVILDVMMPGMDGIQVCEHIRQDPVTKDLPVLMFTALSSDEDVARAQRAGASKHITKPFTLGALGSVIRSFLQPPAAGSQTAGQHDEATGSGM